MTINLHLTRDVFAPRATLGRLAYDGRSFGWTCEDVDRGLDEHMSVTEIARVKVPHETAIPAGRYPIFVRWSEKHQRRLLGVGPIRGYRDIEIHAGNTPADTDGCVLPGTVRSVERMLVTHSAVAVVWLERQIIPRLDAGEGGIIVIDREPQAWAAFGAST